MNYYNELNNIFENRAVHLINSAQETFQAKRNNINNNDIDLIINESSYIDVQYSFDFKKYGDIRIDVLSAFYFKDNKQNAMDHIIKSNNNNCFEDFNEKLVINKYGKYLDKSAKCSGVFYFLFDEKKPTKNGFPDIDKIKSMKISKIVYIPTSLIEYELTNCWSENKLNFKINDKFKNNLNEKHSSAFICFNLNKLINKYDIPVFKNREDLNKNLETYLSKNIRKFKKISFNI